MVSVGPARFLIKSKRTLTGLGAVGETHREVSRPRRGAARSVKDFLNSIPAREITRLRDETAHDTFALDALLYLSVSN